VNHSPSFNCDSAVDRVVKEDLIKSTLRILNVSPHDRKRHLQHNQVRVKTLKVQMSF
jgi:hypothetical protein